MLLAIYIEDGQLLPLKLDIGMMSPKRWPKGGQDWDINEKRFCIFVHLELLAKSLWCPEPEASDRSGANGTCAVADQREATA